MLKVQNEDLHKKLKRYASQYTSLREDLADYRARNGKGPYTDFDEEQRLRDKIKVSVGKNSLILVIEVL